MQLRQPGVHARRGQGRAHQVAPTLPPRHLGRLPPHARQRAHPAPSMACPSIFATMLSRRGRRGSKLEGCWAHRG
jgi:hypothetical protein